MADNENTVVDERTSNFLDVEDAAQKIVERLSRLDEESNRYSSAASGLENAAQATRELTETLCDIGNSAVQAIEVVSSVGGPEIVKRLETIQKELAGGLTAAMKKLNIAVVLAGAATVFSLIAIGMIIFEIKL